MEGRRHPLEKRRTGRLRQERLLSSCGPILNLSRGGASILATRSYKGEQIIRVMSYLGSAEIRVRFVRSKRIGFRRFLTGVEFLNPDEETAAFLTSVASAHASSEPQAA